MGRDPEYWRRWRAEHPDYRARQTEIRRQRRLRVGRGDRTEEYRRRAAKRPKAEEPLGPLFPDLVRGATLAFWNEELAADLRQERSLAELEGRDPEEAARAYRLRETLWTAMTAPLLEEVLDERRPDPLGRDPASTF